MENIRRSLNFFNPLRSSAMFYDDKLELEVGYTADIFKLSVKCFNEIFNYLSLKDLYTLLKTSPAMQQLIGKYFQKNFELCGKICHNNGIYTVYSDHEGVLNQRIRISKLNRFINSISHYYEELEPLRYIRLHHTEFTSLNSLNLVCLTIDAIKVKYLRKILPQIETLKMDQCALKGDFYKTLLKHCGNLKQLHIKLDLGFIITKNADWMNHNYPNLEHLHLTPQHPFKIHNIYAFFQCNPHLKHFSTCSRSLWECRNQLLASRVRLNVLEIYISDNYYFNLIDMQLICCLLNKLFDQKLYKELRLHAKRIDQQFCDQLTSVCGLETLSIKQFRQCYSLSRLINLRELVLNGQINRNDIEILSSNLWNLEYLSICIVTPDEMLPFMRRSVKLKTIYPHLNDGSLDLNKLNKEREKLKDANKVIIYVASNIYLATKWNNTYGATKFNLVEMKRADTY